MRNVTSEIRKKRTASWKGFTLAELVVVITILAILATVGFLALSGYSQDAKESAVKANVRSIYTAVSSESAVTGNSPRYYVVHDSGATLSGSVTAYVDGNPVTLTGGQYGEEPKDSNYSAGNPDWTKLKLNPDKFKTSVLTFPGFPIRVSAAYDPEAVTLWAFDASFVTMGNSKARSSSFFQVTGTVPATWRAVVTGNFPMPTASQASSGAVLWLVRSPGGTEPLVDGGKAGVATACTQGSSNGYITPALAHGASASVTKSVLSGTGLTVGTKTGKASCSFSSVDASDVSVSCLPGYVEGPALSCVADVCGGTIADLNAHSTATLQTVTQNWARSATAGACTWDCNSGYGWDSATSSCKASVNGACGTAAKTYAYADSSFGADTYCSQGNASSSPAFPAAGATSTWNCLGLWNGTNSATCTATHSNPTNCAASTQTVNGRPYSVGAFNHGATTSANSSSAVTGGSRAYSQNFSCADGAVSTSGAEMAGAVTCSATGYALIGGSCVPNSCLSIKNAGHSVGDGTYSVDPDGTLTGFSTTSVYCDMATDGGGWTLVSWNKGTSGAVGVNFFVAASNAANVANKNLANTAASINAEGFSRAANTSNAMLKSAVYSATPIIDNATGKWDYNSTRCGGTLSHTSRTAGCTGYGANDNWDANDRFNIAIGQIGIVPTHLSLGHEVCYSGYGWCDFEFYLR